jgi:hypothetical protein
MIMKNFILFFTVAAIFTIHVQAQVFESSNLPIVVIDTDGGEIVDDPRIRAHMGVINQGSGQLNQLSDPFSDYDGWIDIEIRGSSSQMFPKKQYRLELVDDAGNGIDAVLMGLPAEEDWILNAPYSDKSLIRNVLAYSWGAKMGRYAPRTHLCEVVLNGNYMGVFVLIENIKRDSQRVNVNRMDPVDVSGNRLTGGYIIKIDKNGTGWFSDFPPPHRKGEQQIYFQYEYPKDRDIVPAQQQYIQRFFKEFEEALADEQFADPANGYARFIDVDSFVDFLLINELTKNPDAYRISTFMHKQRDDRGGKLFMGPIWDFNLAFGNVNYCTNGNPEGFVFEFNKLCSEDFWLIPFWWEKLLTDPAFRTKVSTRWIALRQGVFQTATLLAEIDQYAALLAAPQQRNFTRWPVLGQYVWPNYHISQTHQEEIAWLKQWVTDRLTWLDANLTDVVLSTPTNYVAKPDVQVFPNPMGDFLQVEGAFQPAEILHTRVVNIRGQIFFEATDLLPASGFSKQIDTSHWPAGMYFFYAITPQGIVVKKLLK